MASRAIRSSARRVNVLSSASSDRSNKPPSSVSGPLSEATHVRLARGGARQALDDASYALSQETDEQLVARVCELQVSAFGVLYDRYARPIYSMAAHLLEAAEAEEATQEVFLRLWQKAGQYDAVRGPFSNWFLAVARNHILDRLRARSERERLEVAREIDLLLSEVVDTGIDVLDEVWNNHCSDALVRALAKLPPEQRAVILLAYFGGLSQSAISAHLSLPLGTVKKRIRLGLEKLRASLSPSELDIEPLRMSVPTNHARRNGKGTDSEKPK